MPANIAHMLICNKAVKVLQDGGEYQQFIDILDSKIYKPKKVEGLVIPALFLCPPLLSLQRRLVDN
jgi:hypothetical protein